MADNVTMITAIFTAAVLWTATIIAAMLWLGAQFGAVKTLVHTIYNAHEKSDEKRFNTLSMRLLKLELKLFPNSEFRIPHDDLNDK